MSMIDIKSVDDLHESKLFKFEVTDSEQCREMFKKVHDWVATAIASGLSISLKTDLNHNPRHGLLVYQGDLFVYRRPKDMRQPAMIPGLDEFDFPDLPEAYKAEDVSTEKVG